MSTLERADPPDFRLGPATRLLWRSASAVHLELGRRAVVVENLPPDLIAMLTGRPGRADRPLRVDPATRGVLDQLTAEGYLWSRSESVTSEASQLPELPPDLVPDDRLLPPVPRLAGELTSLAGRVGDAAAELLAARKHTAVAIHGGGRLGPQLAALLAASGVGRVVCADAGSVRVGHALPGGLDVRDEGRDHSAAAHDAVHRAAPEAVTGPLPDGRTPDLTVLAGDGPVPDERRNALHADGAGHLVVSLGADSGAVGPLVIPGLTSCLRCADLHRNDRDPAWSALASQLAVPRRYGPTSDTAVAALTSAVAALQVLTFLDGGDPACIDGSLEIQLPDWRVRRRSRPVHLDCDCHRGD